MTPRDTDVERDGRNGRSVDWENLTSASEDDERFNVLLEAGRLFHVGLPSILMQFSLYWIFPVSASAVGRELGTVDLGGFSLGCLVGNLTCLSIMEGSLTAADTLMPRAFGSDHYEEVGRLALRSAFVGAFLLSIPIVPLCLFSGWILETLGQDAEASAMAQAWIRMYFIGALPNLLFRVLMRFLLSQHKPWPLVLAAVVPSIAIHPFLLEYFIPLYGFKGSALSIAVTQWTIFLFLLAILTIRSVHHPETWPGLSWEFVAGALELDSIRRFCRLAIGGILSMNEWWFFEIMCFIAGSFGVESLDAHTIAYNLVPLFFMLPLGISIGLAVRMGNVIGESPRKAQKMAAWTMLLTTVVGAGVAFFLYYFRFEVIGLFTKDEEVVHLALDIWPSLSYYMFLIYIMGISLAILRALGMQWRAAAIISASLYGMTLPAVIYFAIYRGGGLAAQWMVLPLCYTVLQIALAMGYVCLDWNRHAKRIRESIARMAGNIPGVVGGAGEETPLLA
eukprot:CAMPEP_0172470908 /NCGR_PEP_ID=MMETSP1065-20121228/67534_1 /TAXON_ID=265537 /ORGANISM="Amphiprora paludosa, Strain CCMP125" /LENGTH=505 /DNA_ID=CAMNT_0013228977 /DNA_START=52 /DNA_END=1569 /DNA_ORIENTATION=+